MSFEYTIANILEEAGVAYKTNGRSFILDCPKCGRAQKLYIEKTEGYFVCWHCEADGFTGSNPAYALHVLTGKSMEEMKSLFEGGAATPLPWARDDVGTTHKEETPKPFVIPSDMIPISSPDAVPGCQYLIGRGIPIPIAAEYGIRYWPRFRRIIFPIMEDGICYGYQARMIDPTRPGDLKILSSKDLPRRSMVMFHHRLAGSEHAVVCEGPVDAIKMHLCGGNVATMGKLITPQQIQTLKKAGIKKIYFALDRDALPGVPDLARDCGLEAYVVRVPDGRGDMGDCTPVEAFEQFKLAERVTGNSLFLYWPDDDKKHNGGS